MKNDQEVIQALTKQLERSLWMKSEDFRIEAQSLLDEVLLYELFK